MHATSPKTNLAVALLVTAFTVGLPTGADSSHGPADKPDSSGYHTAGETPRGGETPSQRPDRQSLEAALLRTTLKEVRIGDLEGAVASLQSLVNLAPDEPSYKKLLAVARRQLEKQGWYRFQEQFYVPGDGPQPGASEANKAQPAMPKDVKDVKPTTLDELVLLRLKLATWLAPHARGSEPARD